jgi:predicted GTPase
LAGKLYPKGIKIHPEYEVVELIKKHKVDLVVFALVITHEVVMNKGAMVNAAGVTL